jgi:hypothetical protein
MPLMNRVTPSGELIAVSARGLLLGNRGGRFHGPDRQLSSRRFASKSWICCQLWFRGRQRTVWASGYTELFFLDEVTALAAGHRPCFECRHHDAMAFATAWGAARGLQRRPRAAEIDRILHSERLDAGGKRRHRLPLDALPDGVILEWPHPQAPAFACRGSVLLRWHPHGYADPISRPVGIEVDVLTPPSIVAALSSGYSPVWHPSARSV